MRKSILRLASDAGSRTVRSAAWPAPMMIRANSARIRRSSKPNRSPLMYASNLGACRSQCEFCADQSAYVPYIFEVMLGY
jgi:hypothetical protein